ncbi:hypothetical protein Sjap_000810 [Stephania japonica]|uniref:Uncharacterized protein n=1 Tax=Stephania japonica TaxID=461633 RepID=A0AAP0KLD1_9MAGN
MPYQIITSMSTQRDAFYSFCIMRIKNTLNQLRVPFHPLWDHQLFCLQIFNAKDHFRGGIKVLIILNPGSSPDIQVFAITHSPSKPLFQHYSCFGVPLQQLILAT